jgi:hypothetical protein
MNQYRKNNALIIKNKGRINVSTDKKGNQFGARKGNT